MDDLSFLTSDGGSAPVDPLAFMGPAPNPSLEFQVEPAREGAIAIDELAQAQARAAAAFDEVLLDKSASLWLTSSPDESRAEVEKLEVEVACLSGRDKLDFVKKYRARRAELLAGVNAFEKEEASFKEKWSDYFSLKDEVERLLKIRVAVELAAKEIRDNDELEAQKRAEAYAKLYSSSPAS